MLLLLSPLVVTMLHCLLVLLSHLNFISELVVNGGKVIFAVI